MNRVSMNFLWMFLVTITFVVAPLLPVFSNAETTQERRVRLERELAIIEQDIVQKRGVLSEKQKERTSLERDIAILDGQIGVAQQQIKHRNLTISKIRDDIGDKKTAIGEADKKVVRSEQSLAQLLRRTHEIDDTSLAEIVLGGTLSDFFEDIDAFEVLQRDLDRSFDEMANLRADLSGRKEALEEKQGEEEQLRKIQVLEKQAIEKKEKEKHSILTVTKGQEK